MRYSSFESPRYQPNRPGRELVWVHAGADLRVGAGYVHMHAGAEIGIVLQGKQEIEFRNFKLICGPGDVWLAGMLEPHSWRIQHPGVSHVVLILAPEFIGNELAGEVPWLNLLAVPPADRPRVETPEVRAVVMEIGHSILREANDERPYWRSVLRLEVLRLMIELRRTWHQSGAATEAEDGPRMRALRRVMPALSLINEEPRRRIPVEEAARQCSLSPSRFHLLFREALGASFSSLELRGRLSMAAQLLARTDRSVAAIAAECGFSGDSHLHRHFVLLYRCTPKQYREREATAPTPVEGAPRRRG